MAGLALRVQELQLFVDALDLRLTEAVDSTLNHSYHPVGGEGV